MKVEGNARKKRDSMTSCLFFFLQFNAQLTQQWMSSIYTFCTFDINFEQILMANFNKRGLRSHDFFIHYFKKNQKNWAKNLAINLNNYSKRKPGCFYVCFELSEPHKWWNICVFRTNGQIMDKLHSPCCNTEYTKFNEPLKEGGLGCGSLTSILVTDKNA